MSEETKHNFPFFPLNLIVMPGEIQPLHIFEPRYKQLIHDIQTSGEHFGIPFMLNNKICKLGSCVKSLSSLRFNYFSFYHRGRRVLFTFFS
jgi:Lon protease-like protein